MGLLNDHRLKLVVDNFIWVLIIFFLAVASITIDGFFTVENFINMSFHSASLSMMVLGMAFCLLSKQMDLSLESTYVIAPAIGVLLVTRWFPGIPANFAVIFAIITGALIGLINGLLVVKLRINSFLATLAMLIVLRGSVEYLLPVGIFEVPSLFGFLGADTFLLGSFEIPYTIFIYIAVFFIADFIIRNTVFGKDVVAVGSNATAAFIAGIRVERVHILVFVVSGMCAAFGGVLAVGKMGSVMNQLGNGDILFVFAGTVLGGVSLDGGKGKIMNALGGGLLLTIITTILNYSEVSPYLIKAIQGLTLLVAMVLNNVIEIFLKSRLSR